MAFEHEKSRLKALVNDADHQIKYTIHALDRMSERTITKLDVKKILRSGSVVEALMNERTGDPTGKIKIRGRMVSRDDFASIVVAVDER